MDTKLPLSALSTSGALAAQGERFVVRFDGDFDAHDHCGHSEPISEFARHREVVLLRVWTWSPDALSGDTRRRVTHFQLIVRRSAACGIDCTDRFRQAVLIDSSSNRRPATRICRRAKNGPDVLSALSGSLVSKNYLKSCDFSQLRSCLGGGCRRWWRWWRYWHCWRCRRRW